MWFLSTGHERNFVGSQMYCMRISIDLSIVQLIRLTGTQPELFALFQLLYPGFCVFPQTGRLQPTCRCILPPVTWQPKHYPRGCWPLPRSPTSLPPKPRKMRWRWSWRTRLYGNSSARWARRWSSQRRAGERIECTELWPHSLSSS